MDTVIVERLKSLWNELAYLKSERAQAGTLPDYVASMRQRRAVERSLQVCIEICLDIGRRIIAIEELQIPDDNQSVFRILHDARIVPDQLVPSLLDMARFRNLIVHDYARIDDAIVYSILLNRLADFESFADAVRGYLSRA